MDPKLLVTDQYPSFLRVLYPDPDPTCLSKSSGSGLKGQPNEKVGEMRVQGDSL
jgi:hypothetical protein